MTKKKDTDKGPSPLKLLDTLSLNLNAAEKLVLNRLMKKHHERETKEAKEKFDRDTEAQLEAVREHIEHPLLQQFGMPDRRAFEAAEIDGANSLQAFRHVTLPLITPSLFFISLVAVIGTFKAFNHIYIMRTGGAQDSVSVVSVLIFDRIYEYHNAGYAAALALVLFVVILGLTVVQNRLLGRRVFYGD